MALSGLTGSLVGAWLALAVLAPVLGVLYTLTAREVACLRQAIARQAEARAATPRVTGAKELDLPRSADYWWAFAGRFGFVNVMVSSVGWRWNALRFLPVLGRNTGEALFNLHLKQSGTQTLPMSIQRQ